MRLLCNQEIDEVSGGLVGTTIPFTNSFIPGANWPAGASGAWAGAALAFQSGWQIGGMVNSFNLSVSGMSLGESIYRTMGIGTDS